MKQALELLDEIEKLVRDYRDSIGKEPREVVFFKTLDAISSYKN